MLAGAQPSVCKRATSRTGSRCIERRETQRRKDLVTDAAAPPEAISEQARRLAPVVWLIGKVQSGKTSIVRALTGASDAEIGAGFRACTQTARIFDFPAEAPIIRFLDTRGLGEAAYDPAADIAYCEDRAHLMLAVVKAMDAEQGAVADTVRAARERHPDWPVVVAQTTLHEGYAADEAHVLPYPFASEAAAATVPEPLRRGLAHQRSLFEGLPGRGAVRFVPIDLTQPGDGYDPVDYGREALIAALVEVAPGVVKVALQGLPGAQSDAHARSANAYILGFAAAAGASDALPVAGVVTVPVLQAAMLRQLGTDLRGRLGPAQLRRVPRGPRHRHADTHRLHVRHPPACQARARVRPDRRRRHRRRRQLRRHLCDRQGRELLSAAEEARRRGGGPRRGLSRRPARRLRHGAAAGGGRWTARRWRLDCVCAAPARQRSATQGFPRWCTVGGPFKPYETGPHFFFSLALLLEQKLHMQFGKQLCSTAP